MINKNPQSVDEYISGFPEDIRKRLTAVREAIRKNAPKAEEKISYGMPAFTYNGMLVYFAAHSAHIGFYPLTTAIVAFKDELSEYKTAKGSIQFPYSKELPVKLIAEIVKFRVIENENKAALKPKKSTKKAK